MQAACMQHVATELEAEWQTSVCLQTTELEETMNTQIASMQKYMKIYARREAASFKGTTVLETSGNSVDIDAVLMRFHARRPLKVSI